MHRDRREPAGQLSTSSQTSLTHGVPTHTVMTVNGGRHARELREMKEREALAEAELTTARLELTQHQRELRMAARAPVGRSRRLVGQDRLVFRRLWLRCAANMTLLVVVNSQM